MAIKAKTGSCCSTTELQAKVPTAALTGGAGRRITITCAAVFHSSCGVFHSSCCVFFSFRSAFTLLVMFMFMFLFLFTLKDGVDGLAPYDSHPMSYDSLITHRFTLKDGVDGLGTVLQQLTAAGRGIRVCKLESRPVDPLARNFARFSLVLLLVSPSFRCL